MKIGLRTIKTAVAAPIALLLAGGLSLESAASAAIITILTVTNTKRSTAKTALNRLFSLTLATSIAAICFSLLGFHPIVFGLYLLFFIPLSIQFDLAEGIAVSSVLITHYLAAGEMPVPLIINEYLLMIIGVGCALAANLYMPNTEKKIQEDQAVVEVSMKKMLGQMSAYLNQPAKEELLTKIAETDQRYQQKKLPESRQSFEERAMLFQLFRLFQDFIEIKAGFNRNK